MILGILSVNDEYDIAVGFEVKINPPSGTATVGKSNMSANVEAGSGGAGAEGKNQSKVASLVKTDGRVTVAEASNVVESLTAEVEAITATLSTPA